MDFYPRPPRGGRLGSDLPEHSPADISIHALREEGDFHQLTHGQIQVDFYPRPPRGGRPALGGKQFGFNLFLSTPSARRATGYPGAVGPVQGDFYPRPPRGGRPSGMSV